MKCVTIIGNLGANAVIRTTSDGKQLMTFNVAVNQPNKDPLWFNCVSNMREKLFPYLVKGQSIAVVGDLSAELYKGQIDLTVNADKIELAGKAPESSAAKLASDYQPSPVEQEQTLKDVY